MVNFHRNSDKHPLYAKRAEAGTGLKSFEESYIMRIVSLKRHIGKDHNKNRSLEDVFHYEKDRMVKLGEEYEWLEEKELNENQDGRIVTAKIKTRMQKNNKESWLKQLQHGYLSDSIKEDQVIDQQVTCQWLKAGKFTPHIEGFLCAIHEQEINTPSLRKRRGKDHEKKRGMPIICKLWWAGGVHLSHHCSVPLSLHARQNTVAKEMCNQLVHQLRENENRSQSTCEPQTVTKVKNTEIWWYKKVTTQKKIPHNRPDLVIWNNDNKQCKNTDVSVPLDTNLKLREKTNMIIILDSSITSREYIQRISIQWYQIPVIIGALGTIAKSLETSLIEIGIKK